MKNVEEVVGGPFEVGCVVTSKGRSKAIMTGGIAGGALGSAAKVSAQMAVESQGVGTSPLPSSAFALGYLAVTSDELVVCAAKQGMVSPKATEVLARAPRAAVASVAMGDGKLQKPMVVTFADGMTWEFEIPRVQVKDAEKVCAALG